MQFKTKKQSIIFAPGIQETLGLGQAGLVSKDNSIPKAYINYLFFDKENNFKSGGYRQVSEAALGSSRSEPAYRTGSGQVLKNCRWTLPPKSQE
jgi:hypothetical protein